MFHASKEIRVIRGDILGALCSTFYVARDASLQRQIINLIVHKFEDLQR